MPFPGFHLRLARIILRILFGLYDPLVCIDTLANFPIKIAKPLVALLDGLLEFLYFADRVLNSSFQHDKFVWAIRPANEQRIIVSLLPFYPPFSP